MYGKFNMRLILVLSAFVVAGRVAAAERAKGKRPACACLSSNVCIAHSLAPSLALALSSSVSGPALRLLPHEYF